MTQQDNTIKRNELRKAMLLKEIRRQKRFKTLKIIALATVGTIGLLSLYFSFYMFFGYMDSFPTFERPKYEYYGGDAYTGVQNATADVANNIAEVGDLLKNLIYDFSFAMGALFLIIGILLLVFAAYMLCKTIGTPIVADKLKIDSIVETEWILKE